jgi:hypothetical protein
MSKKANNLLPIGARVRVQETHEGYVTGYGFLTEAVATYGQGQDVVTKPCYLVRLDTWIDEGSGSMAISVIVANPDNVKEA